MPVDWQEYIGAFHVHTRYSDGTGSVPDVIDAAKEAGLDFIVLSDHDTMAARREGWEGSHEGLTVILAPEITPLRQGHVLAMNVDHCLGYAATHNRTVLDDIAKQGGYAIIAHPMGKHKPSLMIRHAPWYDWQHPVVKGLEIWSYTHDWVDGVAWWRLPAAYEFWKHPQRRVRGPEQVTLARWDRLGRERCIAGWGGLDCHAKRVPLTRTHVFPYRDMFRYLRNHVFITATTWERDPVGALWKTLEVGCGFVAHDILADSAGTRCTAKLPDGRIMQMGQEAQFEPGTSTTLSLPSAGKVRWIANGQCRLESTSDHMEARPAGPGVYRFEVWLDGAPWIFTNPFHLR